MLLQVAHQRCDPLRVRLQPGRRLHRYAETAGHGTREVFDLAGAQRQAVIRHRAGDRRRALDDVEAVHRSLRSPVHPPLGGEVAHVAQVTGAAREEVGVQRQDHVGLVEVVACVDILAERQRAHRRRTLSRCTGSY